MDDASVSPSLNTPSVANDTHGEEQCQNCGAATSDAYCARCGQKQHTERFTLGAVLRTSLAEAVELENGFLATLLGLFRQPGRVVRDYWRRCTKPYMNPVKYLLFALTVLQLVFWQTGALGDAVSGMVSGWNDSSDSGSALSRADVLRAFSDYFVAFFAAGIPLQSALVQWGTPRSYAEHLIFYLFVGGHLALLWSVLLPIAMAVPVANADYYLLLPVAIAYYVWAFVAAHGPDTTSSTWTVVAGATLTLFIGLVLYTLVLGVCVGIYEAAVLQ